MYNKAEVKAGAVIVIALILLVSVVIATSNLGQMFEAKQHVRVFFSDVQGLKKDDPVQVMGLVRGKVDSIEETSYISEDQNSIPTIEVQATVTHAESFSKDTKISIDRSLTGNTVMKIEPGRTHEKLSETEHFMGAAAASMTELASRAGVVAKRLDDFVADLTDKNISGSIRSALINFKSITDSTKLVSESLGRSIPNSEKDLVNGIKSLHEVVSALNKVLSENKDYIGSTIKNLQNSTESMDHVTKKVEQILDRNNDHITSTISNLEKSSMNIKTLTREVRWQPWLLLKKPEDSDIKDRNVYNTAIELSEGAENLSLAVKELVAVSSTNKNPEQTQHLKELMSQIEKNLQKSAEMERKIWENLNK